MIDLTQWLIGRFVSNKDESDERVVRARYGFLEAWVSIAGNGLLFGVKITLGILANSVSLIADAFHTLGDLVSSVVVVIGFRAAKRPADTRHPYGHGRAEPIATLIIALLLVITGVEFAHVSYDRLREPQAIKGGWIVVAAMVLSIVAKEWMARFSNRLASVTASDMLRADAWHHRSDAIAAGLVLLAMVGSELGYPMLDGVFGLGVSALIGLTGYHMGRRMISVLLGEAPDREVSEQIADVAAAVRGVRGVHSVEVHDYGVSKHVVLHVEVAPQSTTQESHAIAASVEDALDRNMNMSAVVHVDLAERPAQPLGLDRVRGAIEGIVEAHPAIRRFHGLHTVTDQHGQYVEFHLIVEPELPLADSHALVHEVSQQVAQQAGVAKVNIHVEPDEGGTRPK